MRYGFQLQVGTIRVWIVWRLDTLTDIRLDIVVAVRRGYGRLRYVGAASGTLDSDVITDPMVRLVEGTSVEVVVTPFMAKQMDAYC